MKAAIRNLLLKYMNGFGLIDELFSEPVSDPVSEYTLNHDN